MPTLWLCTNLSFYEAIWLYNWKKRCTLLRGEITIIFIVFNIGLFCRTYFLQNMKITTILFAIGFLHVKDVFFLGMWWLFCCSTMSWKLDRFLCDAPFSFVTSNTSLLKCTLLRGEEQPDPTVPAEARADPAAVPQTPFARAMLVEREWSCCGSHDPSGTALSMCCNRQPREWCLGNAQEIQRWLRVSAFKGDAHFAQGVIKL